MQAVKEKLQDMNAMRKAKSEARAEEKAEKEIAKARIEIAHEVRLAKEAEAAMDLHVSRAGERAEKEIAKHTSNNNPNDDVGMNSMETTNQPPYTTN
ncbi:Late embryogenesis abundant protein [Sesbania bispinosa]|nr:Late embryogenesis abundant protein [Sesbania bispinosa]